MSVRRSRDLLVWLHVVTSVGWMSQALALFALLVTGLTTDDPALRLSAYSMANLLDDRVLVYLANTSAFTGLMLAALTPWGYFRYWWVLAKFAITVSQFYVAIAFLGRHLEASVAAAEQGLAGPGAWLAVPALLMASAIAFQAWLSVAKPWKRTPWAGSEVTPRKLPTGPRGMFLLSVAVPVFDVAVGMLLGHPLPALSLLVAVGYPYWRSRRLKRPARPRPVAESRGVAAR
jgi:hypothetical protein